MVTVAIPFGPGLAKATTFGPVKFTEVMLDAVPTTFPSSLIVIPPNEPVAEVNGAQ